MHLLAICQTAVGAGTSRLDTGRVTDTRSGGHPRELCYGLYLAASNGLAVAWLFVLVGANLIPYPNAGLRAGIVPRKMWARDAVLRRLQL